MTNGILAGLSPECRTYLDGRLLTKPIHPGEILFVSGAPAQNIIFVDDGLISLQERMSDGRSIEKYNVGPDGVVGFEPILGVPRTQSDAVVMIGGMASWLPTHDFVAARADFPSMDDEVRGYLGRAWKRLAQSVVCASTHSASQRISTWLLGADDSTVSKNFEITQRRLAEVLGLRVATVSEVCSRLMAVGAIHYSRGSLSIIDRGALYEQACGCYERGKLQI